MRDQKPMTPSRLYALAYLDLGQFLNVPADNLGATVARLQEWREMLGRHVRLAVVRLPRGAQLTTDGELVPDWTRRRAAQFDYRWTATLGARAGIESRRIARTVAVLEKKATIRARQAQRWEDRAQREHDAARMAAGLTPWAAQGWR